MIMEDPEWFMMFDKPRYSINHTHKFEWLWSTTGGLMFIFFPSPSIGSYDAWWFTARHEWQPQLMSSTLASGFFLTFIWMQLDMYYPWNPLRSSCYLSIYIHIICWYVYDIFTCQTFIEKLVIELINLSFSTYPFIYWRRACCLNHNFKSQYLLENLGLFYTKHLILPGSTRPSVTHGTRASGLYLKRKAGGDPPKIGWIRGMEKPTGPWDAKDDI